MLFHSHIFLLCFLPIILILFYNLQKKTLLLVLASFVFYSLFQLQDFFLIVISICVNFLIGKKIFQQKNNLLFILGILFNLSLIFIYKYNNYFIELLLPLINLSKFKVKASLPLAISFFTFQQIAFLVSCHSKKINLTTFKNYTLFVSFFPQLIAGPIVKFEQFIPQIKNLGFNSHLFAQGLFIFTVGLVKKVILADSFKPLANKLFDGSLADLTTSDTLVGTLAYTFQIYFDFSGYTDMAIGLGLLFGIKLPLNFNSPYKAINISQFWRRWHITLSQFFRDYLYIPLGGNRKGSARTIIHLLITMLIVGLWHGANTTFIVWGGLHGLALLIYHLTKEKITNIKNNFILNISSRILTFTFISLAWVIFRSNDLTTAVTIYSGFFHFNYFDWLLIKDTELLLIFAGFLICIYMPNTQQIIKAIEQTKYKILVELTAAIGTASLFCIVILYFLAEGSDEFIYFQF